MKNLRIWSLLCLIWMGVLAASAQDTGKEKISLGDAMPAITLSSEIYGKVTPADLKGKVVLVSLFATWCGPCQIELAEVQKTLWPKYKDNKDFKLLVIGREHTDAELKNTMNGRNSVSHSIRTLNGKSSLFLPTRQFPERICSGKTVN